MASASSSVNSKGRSDTCLRSTASGIRGPFTARARMNSVSPGEALAAIAGASVTRPLTLALAPPAAGFASAPFAGFASAFGAAFAATGPLMPPSSLASAIPLAMDLPISESGGRSCNSFSQ